MIRVSHISSWHVDRWMQCPSNSDSNASFRRCCYSLWSGIACATLILKLNFAILLTLVFALILLGTCNEFYWVTGWCDWKSGPLFS